MFLKSALFVMFILCVAHPAWADQAEVKEIARNNGCSPKKIDVFQQSLGAEGQTIYRVQCNMPKVVGNTGGDTAAKPADELLIGCRDTLCEMLRPYQEEKK